MELRLDAVIDKVDNLSRDVEIGKMLKQYDEAMERPHDNLANVTALPLENSGVINTANISIQKGKSR